MPAVVTTVVGPLVVAAPLVAALVVCLVVTVRRRARDRRGARLVVVGLVLAFVSPLLGAGLQGLSGVMNTAHYDAGGGVRAMYTVVNVIASLFNAAGWLLAAVALIGTRRSGRPAAVHSQPPTA
jgi:formate hydrogenlyase subunit 3/multisubunit Na+/H+ antiporter MnhD subunit